MSYVYHSSHEYVISRGKEIADINNQITAMNQVLLSLASKKLNKTTAVNEIGTKYTLKDVKDKVNEIVAILKGEA